MPEDQTCERVDCVSPATHTITTGRSSNYLCEHCFEEILTLLNVQQDA